VFLIEGSQQTNASLPVPKENAQGVSRLIVAARPRERDVARRWTPTKLRSEPLEAGAQPGRAVQDHTECPAIFFVDFSAH